LPSFIGPHSRAHEREERAKIVLVRGMERRDITFAGLAHVNEMCASPAKASAIHGCQEQVGGKARMTSISVRVGMIPDQPVMKLRGDFIRFRWPVPFL
jgi:hypothetical protein